MYGSRLAGHGTVYSRLERLANCVTSQTPASTNSTTPTRLAAARVSSNRPSERKANASVPTTTAAIAAPLGSRSASAYPRQPQASASDRYVLSRKEKSEGMGLL